MAELSTELQTVTGPLDFDPVLLRGRYDAERDRRRRTDAATQYLETTDRFEAFGRDTWADGDRTRQPVDEHNEVIIVGGGWGGLLLAARLRQQGFDDIRLIDNAGDFGGTWYWNRYPGAMCDVEAHIYMPLLEELDYAPTQRYASATELFEHAQRIGRHYRLYEDALFHTSINTAKWSSEEDRWVLQTDRGDHLTARFLLLACGRQSLPKLPDIEGIESFGGHMFHTSRWDYGYTGGGPRGDLTKLADKAVAVVGTGATAVQVVPELAKYAAEVYVFQRTPSSVGVRGNQPTGADWVDRSVPGWQRRRQENFQLWFQGEAQPTDEVDDGWTEAQKGLNRYSMDSITARLGRQPLPHELEALREVADFFVLNGLRARVDEIVADSATAEALKPWYRWLCKRPCFHDSYLQSFNRPNVHLVDTEGRGVERFTERGIVAPGGTVSVDCTIFATGFESAISYTHLTGFDLVGLGGRTLSEHWNGSVRTLHGVTTDHFPNCMFIGANQQTAAVANATHLLDEHASHVAHVLRSVRNQGAGTFCATSEAVDEYIAGVEDPVKAQGLLDFYDQCTPGYYNAEGTAKRSDQLFAGGRFTDGAISYFRMLEKWRRDDCLSGLSLDSVGPLATIT